MDRHAAPFSPRSTADAAHEPTRRRVSALPPPPGTYAPRLPPHGRAGSQEPTLRRETPELSPAVRRCLTEVLELLNLATALLRDQTGKLPPAEAGAARPTPRLVAIELGVAGHDRAEVHRRLASEFPMQEIAGVLDEVFGAGTPGNERLRGARVPPPGNG